MGSIQNLQDVAGGYVSENEKTGPQPKPENKPQKLEWKFTDFEDKETRSQMELIDELQKLKLQKYIDLPQLVVVGDQSTGKSSVLQAVTGIPFHVKDTTCTRFATEIRLRRTPATQLTTIDVSIIPSVDASPEKERQLNGWRPENFDPNAPLTKLGVQKLLDEATEAIFKNSLKKQTMNQTTLSKSTLRITRSGPDETNFAIVDLPGLIRGEYWATSCKCPHLLDTPNNKPRYDSSADKLKEEEGKQADRTARFLVEKYLKNMKSIIVAVIDVVDLDRQEIYHMVNSLPEKESRVVGVINKCDKKDSKSDDWVFDLIRNDPSTSKIYLDEGWYGLRNRKQAEQNITDDERDLHEIDLFSRGEWKDLDPERLGRHQLKKALIRMRNRHVKKNIPELVHEIEAKLNSCLAQISRLGPPRDTSQAQFLLIHRIATEYSKMANDGLTGHYKDFQKHTSLYSRKLVLDDLSAFQAEMYSDGLTQKFNGPEVDEVIAQTPMNQWFEKFLEMKGYKQIRLAIKNNRSSYDPNKVNPEVEDILWKLQTRSWEEIASKSLETIEQTIFKINSKLFQEACSDDNVRFKLQMWLQDDFDRASVKAKEELKGLIMSETGTQIFTLNPNKQIREQVYYLDRIRAITEAMKIIDPNATLPQAPQPPSKINHVSADIIIHENIAKFPELVAVLKTHDSLRAYYDVALCRFIDNFATQVVERHLLGPEGPLHLFNCDYVSRKLYGPEKATVLHDLACEEKKVTEERLALEAQKASLEESKKRVQNFKIM